MGAVFTLYFQHRVRYVMGILGHVLIASAAAYPLSKHRFPGKELLFTMVVLALMFSPHVTQIPNYMIMSWIGLSILTGR